MTEEQPEQPTEPTGPDEPPTEPPVDPPVEEPEPEPEPGPLSYDTDAPDVLLNEEGRRPTEPPTTVRGEMARQMVYAHDEARRLLQEAGRLEARSVQTREMVIQIDQNSGQVDQGTLTEIAD